MSQIIPKNNRNMIVAIIGVGILTVLLAYILDVRYQYFEKALLNMNLIPKEEKYTELYFDNYQNLPKNFSGGPLSFSFVIHNLEGTEKNYQYVIYYKSNDGKKVTLNYGDTTILDGGIKIIKVSYKSLNLGKGGMIVVELSGRNQQIDFLM